MPRKKISPYERVMAKVTIDKDTGCWLFVGARNEKGYGLVGLGSRKDKVGKTHRVVYKHHKGEIPEHLFVCHKCDVPNCCNPDHLFLGTLHENNADMFRKGRNAHLPIWNGETNVNAKLTKEKVLYLRNTDKTVVELSKEWGLSITTLYRAKNKTTWRHV